MDPSHQQRVRRQPALLYIAFAILAGLSTVLAMYASRPQALLLHALIYALAGAAFYVDQTRYLAIPEILAERIRFQHWLGCAKAARRALIAWATFVCGLGAAQIIAARTLGSEQALFNAVGVMYPRVAAGEFWRFVTGPYLHLSVGHFAVNLAFATITGFFACALLRGPAVIAFIVGNLTAAAAQYQFGGRAYELFGGISGGVYAMCGAVIVRAMLERRLLPRGLLLLFTSMTVIGILGAEAFSDSAATTAHITGLVTGAAVAAASVRRVTAR